MSDLPSLTLIESCAALAARSASPVELMLAVFVAVDRHNPAMRAVAADATAGTSWHRGADHTRRPVAGGREDLLLQRCRELEWVLPAHPLLPLRK